MIELYRVHVRDFIRAIKPRLFTIAYEDIVRIDAIAIRNLCDFLGVPNDTRLLHEIVIRKAG